MFNKTPKGDESTSQVVSPNETKLTTERKKLCVINLLLKLFCATKLHGKLSCNTIATCDW